MTHIQPTQSSRCRIVVAACAVLACAMLCAALRPASAHAVSAGFAVQPLREDMTIQPGQSATKSITITNTLGTTATFTVGKQDFDGSQSDPNAAPVLLGGQVDSPISAANWISASDSSFQLASGASRTLNVTVAVPTGASGGHYAAVTIASPVQKVTGNIEAQSRVAVLFFINAGNVPPPELKISDVYVTSNGTKVNIKYLNTGKQAASPKARIVYRDPVTGRETTTPPQNCHSTALPGAAGLCTVSAPATSPGGPVVVPTAELSFDGLHTKASAPRQWSGGLSTWLLPLAGLALLAFWFVGFRRRRRDDESVDTYV